MAEAASGGRWADRLYEARKLETAAERLAAVRAIEAELRAAGYRRLPMFHIWGEHFAEFPNSQNWNALYRRLAELLEQGPALGVRAHQSQAAKRTRPGRRPSAKTSEARAWVASEYPGWKPGDALPFGALRAWLDKHYPRAPGEDWPRGHLKAAMAFFDIRDPKAARRLRDEEN